MNIWDILLIALLAALLGLAARIMVVNRRKGKGCLGCGGSCAACPNGCRGGERK